MKEITGDQLRKHMKQQNLHYVYARSCSLCNAPLKYVRVGDCIGIDTACHCVSWQNIRVIDWDALAEQVSENDELKQGFKIPEGE